VTRGDWKGVFLVGVGHIRLWCGVVRAIVVAAVVPVFESVILGNFVKEMEDEEVVGLFVDIFIFGWFECSGGGSRYDGEAS